MNKLSIILPGYRHQNWRTLYDSAVLACKDLPFEMIIVGPNGDYGNLSEVENFTFIEDYGAPARCAQIAVEHATGDIFCWGADDGVFLEDTLKECYELLKTKTNKDGIIIRYREGGNFPDNSYWVAHTHADLRLGGIHPSYKIAPVGMFNLEYFMSIGGWDCRFEHLNLSNHDLAFRIQLDGGVLYESPTEVFSCVWSAPEADWAPVGKAYHEVDKPLLTGLYSTPNPNRIKIEWENWHSSPDRWTKRFGS